MIKIADIGMDSINIEIESSSEKAAQGVATLIESLTNLNSKLSGVQNNSLKYLKNMQNIRDTFKNMKLPQLPKISDIFNGGQKKEPNPLKNNNFNSNKNDLGGNDNNAKKSQKNISEINKAIERLNGLAGAATQRIKQMLSYLGKVIIAKAGLKSLNTIFGGIGSKANNLASGFKTLAKNLSKYSLALFGIRSAFYAVRNTSNEFLSSQDAVAKQLSTNIAYLKFSIGSMFAPVIEYITNLIYKLLQAIQALVYIFAKVNIFAGKTAKSYASMAGSAGKTTKEMQKQLQAFDELNNINLEKNNGGGGGAGGMTPSFDLSKVNEDILPKFEDIENLFKEFAQKINKALASINWDMIIEKTTRVTKKIAEALNAFTNELDFGLIGYTIAQGFNTVFANLNTFFDTYNFENLGKKLGQALNSLVNNLDWEALGKTLTNGFKAAINVLYGFVVTFDFGKLGTSIATAINSAFSNINWQNVGQFLYRGMTGILDTFIHMADNVDFQQIGRDIGTALSQINWGEVFSKLVTAIQKAFSGLHQVFKGIFEKVDFNDFTKDLAKGFNELTGKIKTAVENMDLKEAGETFAKNINTLITDIDWGEVASTLGKSMVQLLDAAIGFLGNVDWEELGKKIADFIMGINWGEVAVKIGEILVKLTQIPPQIIWGIITEIFKDLPRKNWRIYTKSSTIIGRVFLRIN